MIVNYVNPNSTKSFLNRFADYIVSKLDKPNDNTSRIQVTDTGSFIIVMGQTTSNNLLNLIDVKNSFIENNKEFLDPLEIENFNIVDIIKYNTEPTDFKKYHFNYYNTTRPIYRPEIISFVNSKNYVSHTISTITYDNEIILELNKDISSDNRNFYNYNTLSVSSTFPHGYSNKIGRTPLYYGEYVCNHIFSYLNNKEICLKFDLVKGEEDEDFNIDISQDSIYSKEDVESLVLDIFDFNLPKFEKEFLSNYDFNLDISNPLDDKPWLVKDKIRDLIII